MSIQVKLRRGTTAQHSTFTGALAEVTVDTDKKTVVVHDGLTPGGFPVVGAVGSVNGQTGTVVLDYTDVGAASAAQGALADTAVQPAAIANMLETSDIGVSVQAYNAGTVVDASYVHTDNNYTTTEKSKLAGIEAGAEVNVNADWNAVSGDAQIINKPTLATVATSGAYADLTGKPSLATVATTGAYADLSGKPSLATVATSGAYNDLTGKPTLGTAASKDAGSANGVAELDGSGTVPTSQLPAAVLGAVKYQGAWNASTNSPTLASGAGTQGYYYVVGTAGSTNLDGITDWKVGDWAIYNGSAWQKIDNTDAVTSVAGRTGAVTLSTSDVSGLGTIATQGANSVSITGGSISGITDLAVADGGTGASDAATARANLGAQATLVSGTNIKSINSTSLLGSGSLDLFTGGLVKVAVVATLPGTPDANTLYIVTT